MRSAGIGVKMGHCLSAEGGVTVLDDVRDFIIRQSPQAICDDCIAANLGLSVRQHANHKTLDLARARGFDRRKDICSICGAEKKVIRSA
jgi:hypothetical protein